MAKLKKAVVEIFVCGQALADHGFATTEVAPDEKVADEKVAVSAATVNIHLQMDGYAYINSK